MKTELLFTPSNSELAKIDAELVAHLANQDLNDSPTNMCIGIFELTPPDNIKPFRTIKTSAMNEYIAITQYLESLGLTCMNQDKPALGPYDLVFLLDPTSNP